MQRQDFVQQLVVGGQQFAFYDIAILEGQGFVLSRLPFAIKIQAENLLRHLGEENVSTQDQAAMRDTLARLGGDPQKINPVIPVDLVIDHSVQVDNYGSAQALAQNVASSRCIYYL